MKRGEKEQAIDKLKREVDLLKAELDLVYDLRGKVDKNAVLLERLFKNNVIGKEGNLKNPINFNQESKQ